jgi:hypothetical protein
MNIYQAHLEVLSTFVKKNIKFFRTTDLIPTQNYYKLLNICNRYDINFKLYDVPELFWRLKNNDFDEKICEFCGSNNIKFKSSIGYRKYCSTKCSAKHRDNSTRRGFVCEEGRKKYLKTLQEKYGVQHQMHITSSFEEQQNKRYKTYDITSPTNKKYKVQGYERFVIPYLWSLYDEEDLVVKKKDLPKIFYNQTKNNKNRKYYPDAYIKSLNAIIEVKSIYTIKEESLLDKIKGVVSKGYKFHLYLYHKGEIMLIKF